MAWTVPLTATANTVLTAEQWNASVRDNLNETTPGRATGADFTTGRFFVTDGANVIAERAMADHAIDDSESTTSTSYTNLTTVGPFVSVFTGYGAMVWISTEIANSSTGTSAYTYEVSGATTLAADDDRTVLSAGGAGASNRWGVVSLHTILIDGTNIFTGKYRVTANTGIFGYRRMVVMGL